MRRALAVLCFLLLSAPLVSAQERVTVPVVVTDGFSFAQNLTPDYFLVKEGKEMRRVLDVKFNAEAPVNVAILLEYTRKLPTSPVYIGYPYPWQDVVMEEAAVAYRLTMRLGDEDRVALATYDRQVRILADFTRNKGRIVDHLESLINNSGGPSDNEVSTADAVVDALAKLAPSTGKHKLALVIIGTGFDTFGQKGLEDALQAARSSGIQIFFLQVGWQAIQKIQEQYEYYRLQNGRNPDPWALVDPETEYSFAFQHYRGVARASAGFGQSVRFVGEAEGIAEGILLWVRNRHLVTYDAPPLKPDGKLKKLKIEIVKEVKSAEGTVLTLKAITVDGRRRPKEKKQ